jgi:hypothetical protein
VEPITHHSGYLADYRDHTWTYRPACRCGWTAPKTLDRDSAEDQALRHAEIEAAFQC